MPDPTPLKKTLHLITQRDQPYGSTRYCCERCGGYGVLKESGHEWTDDPERYDNPPPTHTRCTDTLTPTPIPEATP